MNDNLFNVGEPKIQISTKGLHVVDVDIADNLEKKNISASLITSLESCAAKWLAENYVIKELTQEEDTPASRGSLFHKVMEEFFHLPPDERTKQNLKEIANNTLHSPEFIFFKDNKDAKAWLNTALKNYYKMKAKPEKVKVATVIDQWGKERLGLEVFVKGKIGNISREVLGFIDILLVDPYDPSKVIIQDWKTGKKKKIWNPKTKDSDGLGEARQQVIYSMILEQQYGLSVSKARLIFPLSQNDNGNYDPGVVNINLEDDTFNKNVVKSIESTDKKMNVMVENNTFEYTPHVFCAWCPLAKLCPAANIMPYAKMQEAYKKQPDIEFFNGSFEII